MWLSTLLDNFSIGARSAFLSPGRGFAVFAGVLLSTIVFTSVLAYGTKLGQVAMQESIKEVLYDAFVSFKSEPGYNPESRTNDVDQFSAVCNDFIERPEFTDCSLIFARQGLYPHLYDNQWEASEMASHLRGAIEEIHSDDRSDTDWNKLFFIDEAAIDGPLGDAFSEKIVDGTWYSNNFEQTSDQVILPRKYAANNNVQVGDIVNITYEFISESIPQDQIEDQFEKKQEQIIKLEEEEREAFESGDQELASNLRLELQNLEEEKGFCGTDRYEQRTRAGGMVRCVQQVDLQDISVLGLHETIDLDGPGDDWSIENRILLTTKSLNSAQTNELMKADYAYLFLKIDRSAIPSSSISDAQQWLVRLEDTMQGTPSNPVRYGDIEINYQDQISAFLSGLTWFVVFIQLFDYVLMIPVILLTLAVLIYGLNLALEQRRSEIAIHRVYGGTARALLGLILAEVILISVVAWIIGYILGIFSSEFIINAVGFMEFEENPYDLSWKIPLISTVLIFVFTVGLATIIAFVKTKRFLSMEIEEGIKKEVKPKRNKVLLLINLVMFALGIATVVISVMNPDLSITIGAFYIFGPFLLWIGGALILSRISGYGPRLAILLFGKTPLLSDVKIGIRTSDLNRSMNQLGLIVVLTISIVTMAVVQGNTGSLVDDRTASARVGADMQINFSQSMSEKAVRDILDSAIDRSNLKNRVSVQSLTSVYKDQVGIEGQRDRIDVVVLSENHRDVLHWNDQALQTGTESLHQLSDLGFTAGSDAAKTLDLATKASGKITDIFSGLGEFEENESGFNSVTLTYPMNETEQKSVTVNYISGHHWIPGELQQIDAESVILIEESTFEILQGGLRKEDKDWFVEICDEKSKDCGNALKELNSQIGILSSVVSVKDWANVHSEFSRTGGLIFGTPGILSLQYIVAAFATLASSLVFLSLILSRRRRELAILQSIGASASQLSRLVIFEIISVFTFSLLLGALLGLALAETFTGLFSIFGGLFQLVLGSEILIARQLVWSWPQLLLVNSLVFVVVLLALLITTLRAIRSDLPTVLKEE